MSHSRKVVKAKVVTVQKGGGSNQHVSANMMGLPNVQVVQPQWPPPPNPPVQVNPMAPVWRAPLPSRAPIGPPMHHQMAPIGPPMHRQMAPIGPPMHRQMAAIGPPMHRQMAPLPSMHRQMAPLPYAQLPPPAQEPAGITTAPHPSKQRTSLGIELPDHWSAMRSSDTMKYEVLNSSSASDEYNRVYREFLEAGGPRNIKEITRLQCLGTYQLYTVKRSEVEKELADTNHVNVEEILYHGTSPDVLEKISQEGFNRSLCGKNATKYGKGTYFAKDASYASQKRFARPDANGYQYVLRCRVITGEYTLGKKDYKLAPENPAGDTTRFHSVVDDLNKPKKFIVFHDAQAYAEYVIRFKQ